MKYFFVVLFFAVCTIAVPTYWCGILRSDGSYIPGSYLVWAENANIAKRSSAPGGIPILTELHDAVVKVNNAFIANQMTDAIGNLYVIVACQKLAKPYITNPQCQQWFATNVVNFEAVVRGLGTGTASLQQFNAQTIQDYAKFQSACNTSPAYNNNYYYCPNNPYSRSY